jgi:assimilatory nitrate reductase catalytic subunit
VLKKVARAPGEALADFSIFKLLAQYWGCGELFAQWNSPADAFESMKALSRGRPFDITGIDDYAMIDAAGGIQWPYPDSGPHAPREESGSASGQDSSANAFHLAERDGHAANSGPHAPREERGGVAGFCTQNPAAPVRDADCWVLGTKPSRPSAERDGHTGFAERDGHAAQQRRLFADGRFFTPDGKARLIFDAPSPIPEPPCDQYPFLLLTGRGTVSQWHTQTRTSKSAVLRKLYPQHIYFEIHPQDAARLGIRANGEARIESRRGSITARAFVTASVQPGQVFLPMHYAATNQLTLPHFDPHSRQPSYKDCAVQICAIDNKERRS